MGNPMFTKNILISLLVMINGVFAVSFTERIEK